MGLAEGMEMLASMYSRCPSVRECINRFFDCVGTGGAVTDHKLHVCYIEFRKCVNNKCSFLV